MSTLRPGNSWPSSPTPRGRGRLADHIWFGESSGGLCNAHCPALRCSLSTARAHFWQACSAALHPPSFILSTLDSRLSTLSSLLSSPHFELYSYCILAASCPSIDSRHLQARIHFSTPIFTALYESSNCVKLAVDRSWQRKRTRVVYFRLPLLHSTVPLRPRHLFITTTTTKDLESS